MQIYLNETFRDILFVCNARSFTSAMRHENFFRNVMQIRRMTQSDNIFYTQTQLMEG